MPLECHLCSVALVLFLFCFALLWFWFALRCCVWVFDFRSFDASMRMQTAIVVVFFGAAHQPQHLQIRYFFYTNNTTIKFMRVYLWFLIAHIAGLAI